MGRNTVRIRKMAMMTGDLRMTGIMMTGMRTDMRTARQMMTGGMTAKNTMRNTMIGIGKAAQSGGR